MTRRVLRTLVVVAATAVLSACVAIPSSGPVTKVADDGGLGESAVRYTPARPQPGASPEQIVRGYLDAMLAFPTSSRTAAAFLTPTAGEAWSPSSQVRIYSQPQVGSAQRLDDGSVPRDQPNGPMTVQIGFTEDAQLDRQGRYARRDSPAEVSYTLQQVRGEWRIANPQDGLLVNRKFFSDYFRSFNLYFFDRPGQRLVPDPVYVVVGDQLATTLVTSLAGGPAPGTKDAIRTYVPERAALRPAVPVSADGVADVEFGDDFGDLSANARDHVSAQIVWTLRQVPEIEGVQVVGDATALTAGGDEIQPVQAWGGYGPSTARGRAYAVIDRRVVEIDGGDTEPLSGAWGQDARGAELVAVAESGVAGVLPGRNRVRLTARDGTAPVTIRGNDFLEPDWDSEGRVWLLDRTSAGVRARVVEGGEQATLDTSGLADLDVQTFKLSPDGSRYALTATGDDGGELFVGAVLRDAQDRVLGLDTPARVFTTAQAPRSASWSSSTELSFLADSDAGTQIYLAAIDGSATTSEVSRSGALLPDVDADTLAVGQGGAQVLYVTDAQDRLWYLPDDGTWRLLDTPKVTGLTYGR